MREDRQKSKSVGNLIHNPVIRTGVLAGAILVAVMLGSLFAATRMPRFDSVAAVRNLVSCVGFGLAMVIPVARYFTHPWKLFAAGLTAWSMLAAAYAGATIFFDNLVNRLGMTPLHLLMLGAVTYGVLAVMIWVASSVASLLWPPTPELDSSVFPVTTRKQ
jgi:hypothetical protein